MRGISMKSTLTVTEAALRASLTTRAVRKACQQRRLPADKDGRSWIIDREDLEAWINNKDAHRPGVKAYSK